MQQYRKPEYRVDVTPDQPVYVNGDEVRFREAANYFFGAAVVGAGVTRDGKKILSDVDDDVEAVAGWMSPRLGGVGPMTVAMLLSNTVKAAMKRA